MCFVCVNYKIKKLKFILSLLLFLSNFLLLLISIIIIIIYSIYLVLTYYQVKHFKIINRTGMIDMIKYIFNNIYIE